MIKLFKCIQVDKGFTRGLVVDEFDVVFVMQQNPNYRIISELAEASTITGLKPYMEQFENSAKTLEMPNAKYVILRPTHVKGKLKPM